MTTLTSRDLAWLAPTVSLPTATLKGKSWVVSLTGTAGDDVFDPGTGIGASTMTGGGGNDVFYVHSGNDHVIVPAGPGRSTVIVDGTWAYTLPANVANLVGNGTGAMSLTGNALDNIIRANGFGDTINGGAGADTLVGGAGSDVFVVAKGNGSDTILNFKAGSGGDRVQLQNYGLTSFAAVRAAMSQSGADVVLNLGSETLTFAGHQVGDFVAANFGLPDPAPAPAPSSSSPPSSASGGGGAPLPSVVLAPAIPQPAAASDLVGLVLQNPTSGALAGRYISFGQEFAPGQVPAGRLLQATINGVVVPVQMDVKATNADGSVRMAVLTIAQPALAAGASQGVMLQLAPPAATQGGPLDIASLTRGGYALTVDLTLHNANGGTTPVHIDAAQALAQALASGKVSYWEQGPLATQARIDVPVAGSLHVVLDITAYADGTTSTDVQFANDLAMTASGGEVKYDATIRQNGQVAFTQSNIDQFQYQTWHQLVYSNGAPGVNVQHDIAALERAGFVQNYDLSTGVAGSVLAAQLAQMKGTSTTVLGTPSFGVLGNAGVDQYMPMTGGRPDIGPTTGPNAAWLLTQDAGAAQYALAQADAAGSIPWHLYDPTTGTYLTTTNHPNLWADPRGGLWGTTGLTQQIPGYNTASDKGSGWAIDSAHEPDLAYDAYLLTGSRYYLDQINAQASYNILANPTSYRPNGQQGVVASGQAQVRWQAWDLRSIQEAAFINPDNSALKAYFTQAVNQTFTYLLSTVIPAATATEGQAAGWIPGTYGSTPGMMAPWQQDYFAQVVAMAAEQGNAQAEQVLHWESNYIVGRFLQATNGFDPHDGVAYNMVVGPSTGGGLYQTWAEIEQATAKAGLAANFSGQWQALEYTGYRAWAMATLADDITVEQSPAAIQAYGWLAANSGVTGAWQALNLPQYDIVPRLPDGSLLTASNMHFLGGSTSSAVAYGNADQMIYDNGSGNNTITGGSGTDILFGGAGHDVLTGGAGDDYLYGGSGLSTLSGGAGNNWLQAGSGGVLIDLSAADIARDLVSGFVAGRDHLHLTDGTGAPLGAAQVQSILAGATQTASGLTLTLSNNHSVTLLGVSAGQLTASAFV